VIDLRNFHYEWGDEFDVSPEDYRPGSPARILVRPGQEELLAYGVRRYLMRTDEEIAFAEVSDVVRGLMADTADR